MAKSYTTYQQKAIEAEGTDLCVAAGAGSGKTGVLVERFIRLITQGEQSQEKREQRVKVDEILVITFTEKATKEMKARIVAELTRLGLTEERRRIETAYISTIHGFCARLLQENPFEAGVDPQYRVLDEHQAKRLLRQIIEEVIATAYEAENVEITELIASAQTTRQFGEETGDSLSVLASAVETTLAKLRGAGKTIADLEQHWRQGQTATANQSLEPAWSLITPALLEINACLEALAGLRQSVTGTLEIACRSILDNAPALCPRAATFIDTIAAIQNVQQATAKARVRHTNAPLQEMQAGALFQRIKIACEEAKVLYGVVVEREATATIACHRLWGLVLAVWKAFDRAKRKRGVLDNDDLQSDAVCLLESAPHVRVRYQQRFRHLMIDEFQDTSPLQMRLIDLLHLPPGCEAKNTTGISLPTFPIGASERAVPVPNYLFVVGDVQQSIYGFRNADSTLFRSLERQFREKHVGLHVALAVNFRSRPEILQTITHIFSQVWRHDQTPFVPLTCGASFLDKSSPSLELLLTQDMLRRDYVRLEADALAARVQQMVEGSELTITSTLDPRCGQPITYRDVAILLRGLTDIQKYEEAFARRGVPYFVVGGGRGYYARHEIRDLLNILTVLDTPLNDVALAATLRSPLVGVDVETIYRIARYAGRQKAEKTETGLNKRKNYGEMSLYPALLALLNDQELMPEEHKKLAEFVTIMEDLRAKEDRMPVGHLLERLITRLNYDAKLLCRPGGRRRLANVRKLLQMANSEAILGVRDFIRRLRDLEKISDREGDAPTEEEAADVVRFLTIHGAKGLEFPVVIVADIARGLTRPAGGAFVCEPQRMALGTRLGGEPNVTFKAIEHRQQQADIAESDRLLYVAMTRAREHLILCGNVGRNKGVNWADRLFPLLGILDAPAQPEETILSGGLRALRAPLAHYVHTPLSGSSPTQANTSRREAQHRADQIATAILNGSIDY